MCGIFGAVNLSGGSLTRPDAVRALGETLAHRGPDGEGILESADAIVGTRRLAIVDLSREADQPFMSPDGQVWLVCNGEIYNASELRRRFAGQGYPFRSRRSDVETILPLYLECGPQAVAHLDGMFALAIWDRRRRTLLLARDRAGEKPLFISSVAGEVHFASEIQACLVTSDHTPEVSPDALVDYLALGYPLAPRTMFMGIEKLEAGHLCLADGRGIRKVRYWDPLPFVTQTTPRTAGECLELMAQAVKRQVMSDVPLGVFTSGGLDSSLLVADAVDALGAERVTTYAIQFAEPSYDESPWAASVTRQFGTTHRTVDASEGALRHAFEAVGESLAEPLGDPALLPTYLLAQAARQDVKVILSGEGADELFGGYPTYFGHHWAERYGRLPGAVRRGVRGLVQALPTSHAKVTLEFLAKRFVAGADRPLLDRHLDWFGALGRQAAAAAVRPGHSAIECVWSRLTPVSDAVRRIMLFDFVTYLAENLLTKVDRATMLCSIEARAPYLDRTLMEAALSIPVHQKLRGHRTKMVLRAAARARLPAVVVQRRKRGLSVPIAGWINGSLEDEVDRLLEPARLERQELIRPEAVGRLLAEHRDRRADHARRLWPLIMLQRWHERWVEHPAAQPVV